jgi:hypothetical protein
MLFRKLALDFARARHIRFVDVHDNDEGLFVSSW